MLIMTKGQCTEGAFFTSTTISMFRLLTTSAIWNNISYSGHIALLIAEQIFSWHLSFREDGPVAVTQGLTVEVRGVLSCYRQILGFDLNWQRQLPLRSLLIHHKRPFLHSFLFHFLHFFSFFLPIFFSLFTLTLLFEIFSIYMSEGKLLFPPLRHLWIIFSSKVTYESFKHRVPPL
jgi:hypothetical protein